MNIYNACLENFFSYLCYFDYFPHILDAAPAALAPVDAPPVAIPAATFPAALAPPVAAPFAVLAIEPANAPAPEPACIIQLAITGVDTIPATVVTRAVKR